MSRRRRFALASRGAGWSETYERQQDPDGRGHWFNLKPAWLEGEYMKDNLSVLWARALQSPLVRVEQVYERGTPREHTAFAVYDPERKQILAPETDCPLRVDHHLYQTCECCGQYG